MINQSLFQDLLTSGTSVHIQIEQRSAMTCIQFFGDSLSACSYPNMARFKHVVCKSRCPAPQIHKNYSHKKPLNMSGQVYLFCLFPKGLFTVFKNSGVLPFSISMGHVRQVALDDAGCAQNLRPSSSTYWRMRSSLRWVASNSHSYRKRMIKCV